MAEGSSFAVDALKTITIHMVNGPYNASFHPEFAHQMFGDAEVIVGYSGLRIDVYYHGATLESFVDIMWEKNKPQVRHHYGSYLDSIRIIHLTTSSIDRC